jgi:calcium-dependent protein kinase
VSPELIDNITSKRLRLPLNPITPASDMWAFGVLLYILLHKQFPFYDSSPLISVEFSRNVLDANFQISKKISNEAKHLLSILLQRNPEFRPTAEQVLQHPFMA